VVECVLVFFPRYRSVIAAVTSGIHFPPR